MKVIGIGDNVVEDYTNIRTMFPGGNALNFAVYASMLGCESRLRRFLPGCRRTCDCAAR